MRRGGGGGRSGRGDAGDRRAAASHLGGRPEDALLGARHVPGARRSLRDRASGASGGSGASAPTLDPTGLGESLRGKRILCVGGRNSLVQHYRALVERRGGELLHHDGGREESLDAVTRALGTVDAVLCPIDCVSHAACLMVKRACKHMAKPFLPLRSSGLSSFVKGLRSLNTADTLEPTPAPPSLERGPTSEGGRRRPARCDRYVAAGSKLGRSLGSASPVASPRNLTTS